MAMVAPALVIISEDERSNDICFPKKFPMQDEMLCHAEQSIEMKTVR